MQAGVIEEVIIKYKDGSEEHLAHDNEHSVLVAHIGDGETNLTGNTSIEGLGYVVGAILSYMCNEVGMDSDLLVDGIKDMFERNADGAPVKGDGAVLN